MTVRDLVTEAFERGSLHATATGQRSLTVEGVSMAPIRWQAAVFTLFSGGEPDLPPRAAHLRARLEDEIRGFHG